MSGQTPPSPDFKGGDNSLNFFEAKPKCLFAHTASEEDPMQVEQSEERQKQELLQIISNYQLTNNNGNVASTTDD